MALSTRLWGFMCLIAGRWFMCNRSLNIVQIFNWLSAVLLRMTRTVIKIFYIISCHLVKVERLERAVFILFVNVSKWIIFMCIIFVMIKSIVLKHKGLEAAERLTPTGVFCDQTSAYLPCQFPSGSSLHSDKIIFTMFMNLFPSVVRQRPVVRTFSRPTAHYYKSLKDLLT